jgi:uncharacterized protein
MPKKGSYDYFKSFIEYAGCAQEAAEYLNETVLNFDPETLSARMDALHSIEHFADEINHKTIDHLAKEFLPPIDREDLALLSSAMDDVVDAIDDIMRRMCMYNVTKPRPEVDNLCELLVRCCNALKELTQEFHHFKKSSTIKNCLVQINSLEAEGDTLHFQAVSKLFTGGESALEVIIWRDIFDGFESCYDDCEHVAEVIESVVLKNS